MYTGLSVVRAFGQESKSIDLFERKSEELYRSGWKAQFISGMIMPLLAIIGNISYVFISVLGAVLVIYKGVTIGDVQAFLQYSGQFMSPVQQIASVSNMIQSTLAAAERIFALLDEDEEIPEKSDAISIVSPRGNVALQNVSFGYQKDTPLYPDPSGRIRYRLERGVIQHFARAKAASHLSPRRTCRSGDAYTG